MRHTETPTMREIVQIARRRSDGSGPPMAGGSPIQSEFVAGVAKEAVYGTFVQPNKFVPCVPQIRGNQKIVRPDQARGTRDQVVDPIVGYEVDVTLTGELIPSGPWALLSAGACGNGSDTFSSAGGVGSHVLSCRPQLPSFSYEQDMDIIPGEQVLARQVVGNLVDQWQLKATNQSIATVTAALIGQRETTPTTPGNPSASALAASFFNTIQPMDYSLLGVVQGANTAVNAAEATQVLDLTVALLNHVVRIFSSNGQLYVSRLVPTKREIQLTTLLDFLDTNLYSKWIAGTKNATGAGWQFTITSLTNIPSTSSPYQLAINVGGARPMGEYSNPVASDVVQQNITWSITPTFGGTPTDPFALTWQNDDAGAYA